MSAYTRILKFVNFYEVDNVLSVDLNLGRYKPEIGTESTIGDSDSHLTGFLCIYYLQRWL